MRIQKRDPTNIFDNISHKYNMRIQNSDPTNIFDNISHKYKNDYNNNNKLLTKTFITKRKYYNKPKTFITKKYINIYIVKKTKKIIFIKGK